MDKSWKDQSGKIHRGTSLAVREGFTVIDCRMCEFRHVIPLVEESVQKEFYSEEFYEKEKQNYVECQKADLDWWAIEYHEKYDLLEKYLNRKGNKKLLDIGSGPGFFLKIGKERGWDTTGIEPGIPAYEFSRSELGTHVINEFFSRDNYSKFGTFDVINLCNVLEHIADPAEMLKMSQEILNPEGQICITCPNDFNPLQDLVLRTLKKEPWWVVPKHHINYFDMASLKKLLEKTGFNVLYETVSFPLEVFLLMGEDYIGNHELGRKIHAWRMNLEKNFNTAHENQLKRKIYGKLAELGLGREITIIARKEIK